jgi:hypothetical protein
MRDAQEHDARFRLLSDRRLMIGEVLALADHVH